MQQMAAALTCWRSAEAIVSMCLDVLTEDIWSDLEMIKTSAAKASRSPATLLAIAIDDNEWYKARLIMLTNSKGNIMRHRAAACSDFREIDEMKCVWDISKVDSWKALLGRLCEYKSDLPEIMTDTILTDGAKKVHEVLLDGVEKCEASKNMNEINKLHEYGVEAGLAFPLHSGVNDILSMIRDLETKCTATSVQTIALGLLETYTQESNVEEKMEVLRKLDQFNDTHKGFQMNDKTNEIYQTAVESGVRVVVGSWPDKDKTYKDTLQVWVAKLSSWCLGCNAMECMKALSLASEVHDKQEKFVSMGADMKARCEADKEWATINEVRQCICALEVQMTKEAVVSWAEVQLCERVKADAQTLVGAVAAEAVSHAYAAVNINEEKVKQLSGGVENGDWKDGLCEGGSFVVFMAHASKEGGLLHLDDGIFEKQIFDLGEARLNTLYTLSKKKRCSLSKTKRRNPCNT